MLITKLLLALEELIKNLKAKKALELESAKAAQVEKDLEAMKKVTEKRAQAYKVYVAYLTYIDEQDEAAVEAIQAKYYALDEELKLLEVK